MNFVNVQNTAYFFRIFIRERNKIYQEELKLESKKQYNKPQIRFFPAGSPQFTVLMKRVASQGSENTDSKESTENTPNPKDENTDAS